MPLPRFRLRALMIAVAVAALALSGKVAWDRLDDARQQKYLIQAWRSCWNLSPLLFLTVCLALVILLVIVPLMRLGIALVRAVGRR